MSSYEGNEKDLDQIETDTNYVSKNKFEYWIRTN